MSKALNAVKDGYLAAIDWAEDHPQSMVWLVVLAVVSRLVF